MPASLLLKSIGLLTALCIIALAAIPASAPPQGDLYQSTIKILSGTTMSAGSLLLSFSVGETFLRNGGRRAFKALYWAAFSSVGAGISEAASGLIAIDVPLALSASSLAFAASGVTLLLFAREMPE